MRSLTAAPSFNCNIGSSLEPPNQGLELLEVALARLLELRDEGVRHDVALPPEAPLPPEPGADSDAHPVPDRHSAPAFARSWRVERHTAHGRSNPEKPLPAHTGQRSAHSCSSARQRARRSRSSRASTGRASSEGYT